MADYAGELPEDYEDPDDEDLSFDNLTEAEEQYLAQVMRDKNWALSDHGFTARNDEFKRMFSWYDKEHYADGADLPNDEDGTIMDEDTDEMEHHTTMPIPTNVINSVHGILTDEDFITKCVSSSSKRSQEAATKAERFCHGVYWINRQMSGSDPWEDAILDQLLYGWGCIYSYWDTTRAAVARKKGRSKDGLDFYSMPIVVRRVHPADIYPLPGGIREKWRGIMWIVSRSIREIEDEWNVEILGKQLRDEDNNPMYDGNGNPVLETLDEETMVEYCDYWSWEKDDDDWCLYHCIVAYDQFVKKPVKMPEYEMLPYEIFFCRRTPSDSGNKLGLSFLFPIIEPVQEMEYLANRMSALIDMYADPMLHVADPANGTDETYEKGPGAVITTSAEGKAQYITWNGSPPDVSQLMRMWRETAQDAFPPVMTGLQGGTSGLDTIALQQGGKLQTNKPRRNAELAIQRVNTKIMRLAQKFSADEQIYIVGQRQEDDDETPFEFAIKGKELRGFEHTIVTIRGRFPQEELRNATIATGIAGAGLMSRRSTAAKYLYQQNAQKEFDLWTEEQLMLDPNWRAFFQQMYMTLPAQSDLTQALAAENPEGGDMLQDLAGGLSAAATAENPSQVQRGVQRTAVESNAFSRFAGGAPRGGSR